MSEIVNPLTGAPLGTIAISTDSVVIPDGFKGNVDTSGGSLTVLAPIPSAEANLFVVVDATGDAASNPITVGGNGHTIDGASTVTLATAFVVATFIFDDGEWRRTATTRRIADAMLYIRSSELGSSGGGGGGSVGAAGTIQTSDGAGGFLGATGILADVGGIYLPNNVALQGFEPDGVTLHNLAKVDGTNYATYGSTSGGATFIQLGQGVMDLILSEFARFAGNEFANALPMVGSGSPYGAHGRTDVDVTGSSGTLTLDAAQASTYTQHFTGSAISLEVDYPPANAAGFSYTRNVDNGSSTTLTISVTGGSNMIAVEPGNSAILEFTDTDVFRVTPDTPPGP